MQNNFNQYGYQQSTNYYQPVKLNQYAYVNGIEGAKAFIVQPNQTILLMDSNSPMCYMKQSNGLGQSTIRYFKLVEVSENDLIEPTNEKYVLKSDFDKLMAKIDSLTDRTGGGESV